MTEDEKMAVAIFLFSVISDFVNGSQMTRAEKRRLFQEKCARKWDIPFSTKTRSVKVRYVDGSGFTTTVTGTLALYIQALEKIRVKAAPWMKRPVAL